MKRFSFRLERVLRYRAHLEKRVQLQLCEAAVKARDRQIRIAELGKMRMDGAAKLSLERAEGISVCRDHFYGSFLRDLGERTAEENRKLEKSLETLDRLRRLLTLAASRKKSLESLKEVQAERFNRERERTEQKLLDDLVLITRKRKEP